MEATPERVWDAVSDVTRIGRYSPETFEAVWLAGATGPALGARFKGHVKRNEKGPTYWTECEVTTCDAPHEFAFGVKTRGTILNTWGYRIDPAGSGVDVTESFDLAETALLKLYWALLGWARGKRNRDDMRRTLEAVKADVESTGP
jgi:hypothetical protein